eukprot:CAMPEP_0180520710 /NCGR_PEP_ID=MMETSP1036_2-20121128/56416_1 /TAXON_ID=632150 /ORGANISM="Azadinium spinosum, Strain 3D9" /LENGTH=44 /DNA_ID= /DNA_START= /DNA_END= /DNA_ORIENTATION=
MPPNVRPMTEEEAEGSSAAWSLNLEKHGVNETLSYERRDLPTPR